MKINSKIHSCDHPYYAKCTLFKIGDIGIAVIQQRFNREHKIFWWGPLSSEHTTKILNSSLLKDYILKHGSEGENGLYPTLTLRELLYRLKIKAPKKEIWETRFS